MHTRTAPTPTPMHPYAVIYVLLMFANLLPILFQTVYIYIFYIIIIKGEATAGCLTFMLAHALGLADERKQALAPTGQPTPARAGPDDTSTNNYKKADNEDAKDGSSDLKDQRVCKIGQLCCFMEGHVYESFIW